MANSAPKKPVKKGIEVPLGEPSVVVDSVSVIYKSKVNGGDAVQAASPLRRAASKYLRVPIKQVVKAVQNVSFVAQTGESIGILGANGAGKSTILRMIAGVEQPTSGRILAHSQPQLLGVSAALVPALSGYRNMELGCLAMGLTPEETKEAIPRIADLADIGDSIHRPMQTYSSGMGARLRFAINAASTPDILLIDEALGTGDATFAAKSEKVLADIRANAGTVFLVSHAAQTIEQMCTRALWMHKGQVIADGPAYETARSYRWWAHQMAEGKTDSANKLLAQTIESYTPPVIETALPL